METFKATSHASLHHISWPQWTKTNADGPAGGGFVRVYLTNGSLINSSAISLSLFAIVMTSVLTGTALPFGLARLGVDPANAGTSIQVGTLSVGVSYVC